MATRGGKRRSEGAINFQGPRKRCEKRPLSFIACGVRFPSALIVFELLRESLHLGIEAEKVWSETAERFFPDLRMCRIPGISRWGWNRSKCRHFFQCLPVASPPWCISWTDRQSYPYDRRGRYCSPSLPPSPLLTPKRIPGKKGGPKKYEGRGDGA